MNIAGTFQYHPAFVLNEASRKELLGLEEISELVDEDEVCRTIVDFEFEEVDAQIVYGEIGEEEDTAKFFLRAELEDSSGTPEEVKIFVPEDQENYPSTQEFWQSFNEEETEGAQKVERVRSIAKNFKSGDIVILNVDELAEHGQPAEEDQSD